MNAHINLEVIHNSIIYFFCYLSLLLCMSDGHFFSLNKWLTNKEINLCTKKKIFFSSPSLILSVSIEKSLCHLEKQNSLFFFSNLSIIKIVWLENKKLFSISLFGWAIFLWMSDYLLYTSSDSVFTWNKRRQSWNMWIFRVILKYTAIQDNS